MWNKASATNVRRDPARPHGNDGRVLLPEEEENQETTKHAEQSSQSNKHDEATQPQNPAFQVNPSYGYDH